MTLSALGIFSAAGAGGGVAAGSFDLISTSILGSATSSITFSSLDTYSSTYKHLQIRIACMFDSTNSNIQARINGDSGANYARHVLRGNFGSGAVESAAGTSLNQMLVHYNQDNNSTNEPAASVIDFVDVYAAKNRTMRAFSGTASGTNKNQLYFASGLYLSTAALTSITIQAGTSFDSSGGNFRTGSRFSIYGIKG
jgi:hypothetical protein